MSDTAPADVSSPGPEASPRVRVLLLALAGVAFVGLAAGCHVLGMAGYRSGFALTTAIIGVPAAVATLAAMPASVSMRPVWGVVVVVLAAVVAGVLVDHAPYSRSRLDGVLDSLSMPNLHVAGETRSGHSWCSPRCPTVVRQYESSVADLRGPIVDLAFALEQRRLATTRGLLARQVTNRVRLGQRHFELVAVTAFRDDPSGKVVGVTMRVEITGKR